MIIHICDRCKQTIETLPTFHLTYSGNNAIDLCKNCEKNFKSWLQLDEESPEKPIRSGTE